MSTKTGTIGPLAKLVLQQIAPTLAETARLLSRRRERIGRRTVISATAAEAEMNMTEGNKNKANAKLLAALLSAPT